MTIVKICGLTRPADAEAAIAAGADFLGFVLVSTSPRFVGDRLGALAGPLAGAALRVGVIANAGASALEDWAPFVDAFQLHGAETESDVWRLSLAFPEHLFLKALPIGQPSDLPATGKYPDVGYFLFDAPAPAEAAYGGGHGQRFDWSALAGAAIDRPWLLAGGLTPFNVGEAIALTRAPGVDVSFGVELAPGVKDPALIRAFVDAARRAADILAP